MAGDPGNHGPQITRHMQNEGYSPAVINAARDLVYLNGLSGPNVAWLRGQGVHIPSGWRASRGSRAGPPS
jgi:hypothetical protein